MNRRKLLAFIGLSPLVPFAAKAEPIADSCVMTPSQVDNAFREIMANAERHIQAHVFVSDYGSIEFKQFAPDHKA